MARQKLQRKIKAREITAKNARQGDANNSSPQNASSKIKKKNAVQNDPHPNNKKSPNKSESSQVSSEYSHDSDLPDDLNDQWLSSEAKDRFSSGQANIQNIHGIIYLHKADYKVDLKNQPDLKVVVMLSIRANVVHEIMLRTLHPFMGHIETLKLITFGQTYDMLLAFKTQDAAKEFYFKHSNNFMIYKDIPQIIDLAFVSGLQFMKTKKAVLAVKGYTELPYCPLCRIRTGETCDDKNHLLLDTPYLPSEGLQMTYCNTCLFYLITKQYYDVCHICGKDGFLNYCLICGDFSICCSKYSEYIHYKATAHRYLLCGMELKIWDFQKSIFIRGMLFDGYCKEANNVIREFRLQREKGYRNIPELVNQERELDGDVPLDENDQDLENTYFENLSEEFIDESQISEDKQCLIAEGLEDAIFGLLKLNEKCDEDSKGELQQCTNDIVAKCTESENSIDDTYRHETVTKEENRTDSKDENDERTSDSKLTNSLKDDNFDNTKGKCLQQLENFLFSSDFWNSDYSHDAIAYDEDVSDTSLNTVQENKEIDTNKDSCQSLSNLRSNNSVTNEGDRFATKIDLSVNQTETSSKCDLESNNNPTNDNGESVVKTEDSVIQNILTNENVESAAKMSSSATLAATSTESDLESNDILISENDKSVTKMDQSVIQTTTIKSDLESNNRVTEYEESATKMDPSVTQIETSTKSNLELNIVLINESDESLARKDNAVIHTSTSIKSELESHKNLTIDNGDYLDKINPSVIQTAHAESDIESNNYIANENVESIAKIDISVIRSTSTKSNLESNNIPANDNGESVAKMDPSNIQAATSIESDKIVVSICEKYCSWTDQLNTQKINMREKEKCHIISNENHKKEINSLRLQIKNEKKERTKIRSSEAQKMKEYELLVAAVVQCKKRCAQLKNLERNLIKARDSVKCQIENTQNAILDGSFVNWCIPFYQKQKSILLEVITSFVSHYVYLLAYRSKLNPYIIELATNLAYNITGDDRLQYNSLDTARPRELNTAKNVENIKKRIMSNCLHVEYTEKELLYILGGLKRLRANCYCPNIMEKLEKIIEIILDFLIMSEESEVRKASYLNAGQNDSLESYEVMFPEVHDSQTRSVHLEIARILTSVPVPLVTKMPPLIPLSPVASAIPTNVATRIRDDILTETIDMKEIISASSIIAPVPITTQETATLCPTVSQISVIETASNGSSVPSLDENNSSDNYL